MNSRRSSRAAATPTRGCGKYRRAATTDRESPMPASTIGPSPGRTGRTTDRGGRRRPGGRRGARRARGFGSGEDEGEERFGQRGVDVMVFFFGTDFPVGGRREIWRGSAPRAPWGNPPRGAEARARVRPPRRRIRRSRSMARFVMSSRRGSLGVSCVGVGRDARRRAAPSGNFPPIDRYRARSLA